MSYIEYYDGLVNQLNKKLTGEFNDYISGMKKTSVDNIISHSDEIYVKQKILDINFKKFTPETLRNLCAAENILDKLYSMMGMNEIIPNEILENAISNLAYLESMEKKRKNETLDDKIAAAQNGSQEKKRHIIWSNLHMDFGAWKDDLIQEYPTYSEDALYEKMVDINNEYLNDERMNLDIQLSMPIIVIADLGLWNGSRSAYKDINSGNIKDCLYSSTDMTEWYVDKNGDFRADAVHHDGTNSYLYRVFKENVSDEMIENFKGKILRGSLTEEDINKYTDKIGDRIAQVYGFDIQIDKKEEEIYR